MQQKQKKLSRMLIEQIVYDSMIHYGWEETIQYDDGIEETKHKKKPPESDDFEEHLTKTVENLAYFVGGIDEQLRAISNDSFLQMPIYLIEAIRHERGDDQV